MNVIDESDEQGMYTRRISPRVHVLVQVRWYASVDRRKLNGHDG